MAKKDRKIIVAGEEDVARYAPDPQDSAAQQNPVAPSGRDQEVTEAGPETYPAARQPGDGATAQPADQVAAADGGQTTESLRAQLDEYKDKLLRAQAECANVSKRLRQHHQESLKLAAMDLARNLLPVVDNFERTLSNLGDTAADDPLVQGVKLIAEQFTRVLKDHGIEPIEAVGLAFDPTLHEAMMQDRDSDQPAGTVTQEMQRGYKMNDRVLRPARVAVAAGPEEAEEASPSGDQSPKEQEPSSHGGQQRQETNRADV